MQNGAQSLAESAERTVRAAAAAVRAGEAEEERVRAIS